MITLVDVVNFNSDASCLTARAWLEALSGGPDSRLCRWLGQYAQQEKRLVLGLTGATVADMAEHNPESLGLIREHSEIFECILRPFSHDASLLRSREGFVRNFELGRRTLERELGTVTAWYLPPEFMLTSEQIALLGEGGVVGTFINPARYSDDKRQRLPSTPYAVRGTLGSTLRCIPFTGELTRAYITALEELDSASWNHALESLGSEAVVSWRDGESSFLIRDGLERERRWLAGESRQIERSLLRDALPAQYPDAAALGEHYYRAYPVHSFAAWLKEFRMLGYLRRLYEAERGVAWFGPAALALWLQSINSDVLSSVEKSTPHEHLKSLEEEGVYHDVALYRAERGFEGEESLILLERLVEGGQLDAYARESDDAHLQKLRGRIRFLESLLAGD